MRWRRQAAIAVAAGALLAPASALALVSELTNAGRLRAPSCPRAPCVAISRTTAMQVKDGSVRGPFLVRRAGRVVAWSLTLGAPTLTQIRYFDSHEGGTARAAIAVVRHVRGLSYRLVAESPPVHLEPYFGESAQFALRATLPVRPGDVIALAVPTWAPALSLGYGDTTSWRASRSSAQCANVSLATAQTVLGAAASYDCLYQTALVTYGASVVSTP